MAEAERTLMAERRRRGRQAKLRSGQRLPWTRAPYGSLLDPARPREASRGRIDPVQAAVVEQRFAWETAPGPAPSLYAVAKRLSEAQIPTPRGGKRWHVAAGRGLRRAPPYTGVAASGRSRPAPARRRQSALQPVGPGQSQPPAPTEEWRAVPVPARIHDETFAAAQPRLDRHGQRARRNHTTSEYVRRGLVRCGQCRLSCGGRTWPPAYHASFCRGRTDALRLALGARGTARYAPAQVLDALVWQALCRVLSAPALITHALERAQRGAGLPQALHARRQTLRDVLAQRERQQARRLALSLAEVIEREEVARRRKEVAQSQQGVTQPLRQRDTQAPQHVNVAVLRQGMEAFCQRLPPTLDQWTFAQRRQLVAWRMDRGIVNDTQVEIRSVVPTGPKGETTPFCHLRLDYLDGPALAILVHNVLEAHGESGGEKGLDRRRWFSLATLGGGAFGLASYDHAPPAAPGQHCVPQALPGLELGAVLTGVRRPTRGGVRQGLGRADQGAFFAWGTATLWGREWWQLGELGADGETPHDMGLLRPLPAIVLGGIATVRQAPAGAPGQLRGDASEESTGQRTARTIQHSEGGGLGWFERQFEANRDAEAVAGPTLEGDVHDPQNDVQAPQRPVCLPCGAGAMTVAGEPFEMAPGFFLRGIVAQLTRMTSPSGTNWAARRMTAPQRCQRWG